jgi:rod shape-determining protein MreB
VRSAIDHSVGQIVEAVKRTLESTPPELAADISSSGMLLAGGGALLAGIDRRLAAETGVHVSLAEAPLECVALGAGSALEERGALDRTARRRSRAPVLRSRRRW